MRPAVPTRTTPIPGAGQKTAERIVVELRDKLAAMEPPQPERLTVAGRTQLESDVVSALLNLGYDRRAAEKALEEVSPNRRPAGEGDLKSFEALLRCRLVHLSRPAKSASPKSEVSNP